MFTKEINYRTDFYFILHFSFYIAEKVVLLFVSNLYQSICFVLILNIFVLFFNILILYQINTKIRMNRLGHVKFVKFN